MPQPQRTYCVTWTTKSTIETEHFPFEKDVFEDKTKFFADTEEEQAKSLYKELLEKDNTYCASFCKVLEDSEG